MIVIQDTIISEEVLEKKFTCHLQKCKGACCTQGDRGAPLAQEEIGIIEELLPKIKPFMTAEYADAIAKSSFYELDEDGENVTTCQPTGECNFVVYDATGTTQCAIELAQQAGAIDFKKPISCHLYPIRLQRYKNYTAVNYSHWDICQPACQLGSELNMPVYKFLQQALVRRFGQVWFDELDEYAMQE